MTRRKKPENETPEQTRVRLSLEAVANHATRAEKVSWNRMMDNMVQLIAKLKPIEDKIIELQAKKIPMFDEIQALRQKMVRDCVHPLEHLVFHEDYVECKFCNRKLRTPQ